MLFSSITFLYYFLPAVLVIYYLTPAKGKNLILFLASFVFYLWGEPKYSVLLLFSVTAGYMGGRCIEYQRQKKCVSAADPADRSGKYKGGHDRLVVGIFTAMTLGLLVFFKYMDFLADSVNRILVHMFRWCRSYFRSASVFTRFRSSVIMWMFTGERLRQNTILLILRHM